MQPNSIPTETARFHLDRDRITEEDTTTRQALERVPLTLLTPSHRLKSTRDVQRFARLGSDLTCAHSLFVRKLTSVAHELAAEALSPVGGINDQQIQRPGLRPRAGPVVTRERMCAFEDVGLAWVGGSVFGLVCELLVVLFHWTHRIGLFITSCRSFRKHLVVVTSVSANPFRVAGDGFLAVFDFHGDDVMAFGVPDLLQEASPEVCQEVFWVLFPVRMQQVSEQWVVCACCRDECVLVCSLWSFVVI